jgi:hypothetical protein
MAVATGDVLPHPALGMGPSAGPLSGPPSPTGGRMPTVPLLVMVPLTLTTVPLVAPLLTTLPLVTVPLVEPDALMEIVPEPPLTVPALTLPLTATLLPLPLTPLVRPPQAAITTNTGSDQERWLRDSG